MFGEQDVRALAAANRILKDLRVTEAGLRKYAGPVLFVYGEGESPSTQRYVTAARNVLGRSDIKVIPNAGHFSTPSRPEFQQAILTFLESNTDESQRSSWVITLS
jgi:pimeloyl-ACP methyl ester carboxylesterase